MVDRLFTLKTLQSLEVNPATGAVRLQFSEERVATPHLLQELAEAMRLRIVPSLHLPHEELIFHQPASNFISISRAGQELSFWKIEPTSTSHFRLKHPLLRHESARQNILAELNTIPEIIRHLPSPFSYDTLHVWMRPHRLDPLWLIADLDVALTKPARHTLTSPAQRREDWLVNTNLAVALVTELAFPPLGWANALLVTLLNAPHAPKAVVNLRQGRANLHLLYLSIGVLTLLTFSFFAAAVMYWFLRYWPRQVQFLLQKYQDFFLTRYQQRPRQIWVEQGEHATETKLRDVKPHNILVLSAGDTIPGDGEIISGSAEVHDRVITGHLSSVHRTKGDLLYGGSRILSGNLRMRLDEIDFERTAAGKIQNWYREQFQKGVAKADKTSIEFSEYCVLPVLALGLLILPRGGLSMAKAVLRPDFLSGPQLAEDFLGLTSVLRAAEDGILLPNAHALRRIRESDCIIFDDSVDWRSHGLEERRFAEMLHEKNFPEVVFLSEKAVTPVARLGFDTIHGSFSLEAKRAYIAQRQSFDHKVLYVGSGENCTALSDQADHVMVVLEKPDLQHVGSHPALLGPDLVKIFRLLTLADEVQRETKISHRLSLVPNSASIFSAIYLGGTVDLSVLLTNIGTLLNYLRYGSYLEMAKMNAQKNRG